jgi:hypothetical protein
MIPGQNLLNMCLTLIAKQSIIYYRFVSRAPNAVGQDITTYAAPVTIVGSFQAVPRKEYYLYGLNLQKNYSTFYSSNNVLDVSRDVSGDQLTYNGLRYQVESNNDWYAQDGWKGILVVEIGAA